jgi:hypothetical protein
MTVSAMGTISSTGGSASDACLRIASGLTAQAEEAIAPYGTARKI